MQSSTAEISIEFIGLRLGYYEETVLFKLWLLTWNLSQNHGSFCNKDVYFLLREIVTLSCYY